MNYPKLAFTDAVKNLQEKHGSRANYDRMEKMVSYESLTYREIDFIQQRDSFYMASHGANNYPYIQHRGGPKGFLKLVDNKTLGFLDFSGNMQYISIGNFEHNNKVSLFLMDYPSQTRLKLFAEAEVKNLNEDTELAEKLSLGNYKSKPERIILFHIKAFDWNCPQHITPRFTEEQIQEELKDHIKYTEKLEQEVKELREKLKQYE